MHKSPLHSKHLHSSWVYSNLRGADAVGHPVASVHRRKTKLHNMATSVFLGTSLNVDLLLHVIVRWLECQYGSYFGPAQKRHLKTKSILQWICDGKTQCSLTRCSLSTLYHARRRLFFYVCITVLRGAGQTGPLCCWDTTSDVMPQKKTARAPGHKVD